MEFIIQNWWLAILIFAAICVAGYFLYTFIKMPKSSQLKKLKEWLLYAVAKAEKELGGGTGKLKLRYVYDMFILRFDLLADVISFEAFSLLVDEVLEEFREMLEINTSVAKYIEGDYDK